jgi:hypothetical protein
MLRNAGFELLPFGTMFKFLRVAIGAGTFFIDEIVMNVMRQTLQKKMIFTNQILCGCFRA